MKSSCYFMRHDKNTKPRIFEHVRVLYQVIVKLQKLKKRSTHINIPMQRDYQNPTKQHVHIKQRKLHVVLRTLTHTTAPITML